jgi:hypothetical protein
MLVCCMFMASAMVVSLLLLKNAVYSSLCSEFWVVMCFSRCSIRSVNVIRFPLLMFHLNEHINNKEEPENILEWYSMALLLAHEDFLHVSVFHEHVYGEHCIMTACTHFTHSVCKIYAQGTVPWVYNFVIGYILITNCFC